MSQNLALVIIREKPTLGGPTNFSNDLHTAVSVAFSLPSSLKSEMANTALIYSLTANATERRGAKG